MSDAANGVGASYGEFIGLRQVKEVTKEPVLVEYSTGLDGAPAWECAKPRMAIGWVLTLTLVDGTVEKFAVPARKMGGL